MKNSEKVKKVAIVYDRVNKWGGAERVLLALHEIFPEASLYTSVYDKKSAPWASVFPKIYTSFLQNIPFARTNHELFAPLMPLAFRSFDLIDADVVISVTSEFAKAISVGSKTKHICYCLTPTRYLWSGYGDYFKNTIFKSMTRPLVSWLRKIDKAAAKKVDVIVAISTEVKTRIKRYYGRDSKIIFPPVNIPNNRLIGEKKYYLVVSRLDYGYKKVDLAIQAFNKLGKPLVIVGTGHEEKRLKLMSESRNIKFVGKVSEKDLDQIYANAKALIMPQFEDFGIVSVEAQAHGVPVIAYNKGGAIDTVVSGKTGIYFDEQNVESLVDAVKKFEKKQFIVDNLLTNAKKFSKENFKNNILRLIK